MRSLKDIKLQWMKINSAVGAVLSIAALISLCVAIDSYFAHDAEVRMMNQKLNQDILSSNKELQGKIAKLNCKIEQMILEDNLFQQQKLAWEISDRLKVHPSDTISINQLRIANFSLSKLEKQLELLRR